MKRQNIFLLQKRPFSDSGHFGLCRTFLSGMSVSLQVKPSPGSRLQDSAVWRTPRPRRARCRPRCSPACPGRAPGVCRYVLHASHVPLLHTRRVTHCASACTTFSASCIEPHTHTHTHTHTHHVVCTTPYARQLKLTQQHTHTHTHTHTHLPGSRCRRYIHGPWCMRSSH